MSISVAQVGPDQQPGPVLLPEHLRLPDLDPVRAVTAQDLAGWLALGREAIEWGPDRRNGHHRDHGPGDTCWYQDAPFVGFHSPDAWTPTWMDADACRWQRADGATVSVSADLLYWGRAPGTDGRTHAPRALAADGPPRWMWNNIGALGTTVDLLTAAWSNVHLTEDQAHQLLHDAVQAWQKGMTPNGLRPLPVTAQAWVAHVLAANPSPHLSADFRTWLRLLAP